jgi:hypothetical protein
MSILVDVIDYVGKYENGVLTVLSLNYNSEFYEALFYYTNEMVNLSTEDTLEDKLGCPIEDWDGYNDLMVTILKKVVPHEEIINRLDDIDISSYTFK